MGLCCVISGVDMALLCSSSTRTKHIAHQSRLWLAALSLDGHVQYNAGIISEMRLYLRLGGNSTRAIKLHSVAEARTSSTQQT